MSMARDSETRIALQKCVFLCHASGDAAFAQRLCSYLEAKELRCWIAPRDITLGKGYVEECIGGVASSDALVLLLSADAVASIQVLTEVEQAVKHYIPIHPVLIGRPKVRSELDFYISRLHWMDSNHVPLDQLATHLANVLNGHKEWTKLATPPSLRRSILFRRSFDFQFVQAAYERLYAENERLNTALVHLNNQKGLAGEKIVALQTEMLDDSPRIFISYAREDNAHARSLYQRLKDDGMRPWFDKEDLGTGVEWEPEIRRAIRGSDFVLICFSSHVAQKRGYIQREIRLALDCYNEIPFGEAYLLPVRLDECTVPEDIGRFEYTDLFEADGYEKLVRSIVKHWIARQRSTRSRDE